MISQVVPVGLFLAGNGVIHVCELKAAKAPQSFGNNMPVLKFMELAVMLAGVGAFFFLLLTTGHVLKLVGIAVLAVLADRVVRFLCFYLAARRFCECSGRARHCPKHYRPQQCAVAVNFGDCNVGSHVLKRMGHFTNRRPRAAGTKKPRHARVETHNVW